MFFLRGELYLVVAKFGRRFKKCRGRDSHNSCKFHILKGNRVSFRASFANYIYLRHASTCVIFENNTDNFKQMTY